MAPKFFIYPFPFSAVDTNSRLPSSSSSALHTTSITSNHRAVGTTCKIALPSVEIQNPTFTQLATGQSELRTRGRSETHPGRLARPSNFPPKSTSHRPKSLVDSDPAVIRPLPRTLLDSRMAPSSPKNSRSRSPISDKRPISPTEVTMTKNKSKKNRNQQINSEQTSIHTPNSQTNPEKPNPKFSSNSNSNFNEHAQNSDNEKSRPSSPENSSDMETDPKIRIPPIFIQSSEWRKVAGKLLATAPENSIQAKVTTGTTIKILCADITMFQIVQKYFTKTNVEYYTLPLPDERMLKIIIKGLPVDIPDSEISEELIAMGYEVKAVRQFANSYRKYSIHMVTLPSNPDNKRIFNEKFICCVSVTVESYRSNKPAQCFACQRFGHSSMHCGFAPRCVKCAGPHLAKDCVKPKETDPKCANCNGIHTANYTKCPTIIEEKENRRPKRPNTSPPQNSFAPNLPSATPTSQVESITTSKRPTYAQVAAPGPKIDTAPIIEQLIKLASDLASGEGKVKDSLITLLSILPQLLSQNEHH